MYKKLDLIFKSIIKNSLIILGLLMFFLLLKELWILTEFIVGNHTDSVFYEIINAILTFFLFLEFLELIMHYLSNKNHPSVTLYIYIAIRTLISSHDGAIL